MEHAVSTKTNKMLFYEGPMYTRRILNDYISQNTHVHYLITFPLITFPSPLLITAPLMLLTPGKEKWLQTCAAPMELATVFLFIEFDKRPWVGGWVSKRDKAGKPSADIIFGGHLCKQQLTVQNWRNCLEEAIDMTSVTSAWNICSQE